MMLSHSVDLNLSRENTKRQKNVFEKRVNKGLKFIFFSRWRVKNNTRRCYGNVVSLQAIITSHFDELAVAAAQISRIQLKRHKQRFAPSHARSRRKRWWQTTKNKRQRDPFFSRQKMKPLPYHLQPLTVSHSQLQAKSRKTVMINSSALLYTGGAACSSHEP